MQGELGRHPSRQWCSHIARRPWRTVVGSVPPVELTRRTEELEAARQINRELISRVNRHGR